MKLKEYFDYTKYAEILYLTKSEILFCMAYFVLALFICFYSTPKGSLFSPDSVVYVQQAENIYYNHNLLIYAPVYQALIALGMGLGLNVEQSAGIVPIICYSLLGFPLFLLGKITSRPIAGYITCIICLICGKYLLYISTKALTDMVYLFISVIAMLFFVIYNKHGSISSIAFAGIFALLAALTRNIGITLILAGLIVIITNSKELKKLLTSLTAYCLISILTFFIWYRITRPIYDITTASSNPPLSMMGSIFWTTIEMIFYNDYKLIVLIAILFLSVAIIYMYLHHQLMAFVKDTIPLTSYIFSYSIILILVTSSFWISVDHGQLDMRKLVQIYPFLGLLVVSLFIYTYNMIEDGFYKRFIKTFSIILLICLVAQGANSLYFKANDIRTQSINNYADLVGIDTYISKYNLTTDDIYIDRSIDWPNIQMALFSHQIQHQYKLIDNNIPGKTILDNITAGELSIGPTTLADMIKKNNYLPIYIIAPIKVSLAYVKNPSKDICLGHPYKLSKSVIYKVELIESDSCQSSSFIITNSNSIAIPLAGDFIDSTNDQLLLLSRNQQSTKNEYMQILDFGKGLTGEIKYKETSLETGSLANLPNINSTILSGDFMDFGYSQALFINRDPRGDKIVIEDFSQEKSPAIIRYSEVLGDNSTLKEPFDLNNTHLAGDFQGLGYSQLLLIDHNSKGGKLAIVDFRKGKPHAFTEISEIGDDHIPIASLLDRGDLQFSGDFMGLGYSQVLFINFNNSKAENAKIVIADFSKAPPSVNYLEKWGESSDFGGWLDANDTQLVGDFMGLGHSQVLFVNHHRKLGKVMIADFSQGKASDKFFESWDKGIIFQGWQDINDTRVAGDFAGLGYDQILFINSSLNGIRATIVDFKNGMPIPL